MGNRMLSLLTAVLYARLSGRRVVVDWRDRTYSSDETNVFPCFFCPNFADFAVDLPATDSVTPVIWRGNLNKPFTLLLGEIFPHSLDNPLAWHRLSVDPSRLDCEESVAVWSSFYERIDALRRHFRGEFAELRSATTKDILRGLLRENLQLHPSIEERIGSFKRSLFNGVMIGVHIRDTDRRSPLSAMCRKLDSLRSSHPGVRIFLATDSRKIREIFLMRYDDVIMTEKWYPAREGKPMHWDDDCPDKRENGIGALVDMWLLGECDYLIVDESSSFAYVARLLSKAPGYHVFNFQRGKWLPPRARHILWLLWMIQKDFLFRILRSPVKSWFRR